MAYPISKLRWQWKNNDLKRRYLLLKKGDFPFCHVSLLGTFFVETCWILVAKLMNSLPSPEGQTTLDAGSPPEPPSNTFVGQSVGWSCNSNHQSSQAIKDFLLATSENGWFLLRNDMLFFSALENPLNFLLGLQDGTSTPPQQENIMVDFFAQQDRGPSPVATNSTVASLALQLSSSFTCSSEVTHEVVYPPLSHSQTPKKKACCLFLANSEVI